MRILCFYCINSNIYIYNFEYTVAHFIQLQFQCWGRDVARFFLELNTMEEPMTTHSEESEIFFLSVWLYWSCRVGVWKQLSGLKTWAWNIIYYLLFITFIYLIKPANLLPELLRRTNAVSGILVLKRLPVNPCRPNSNHNEPTWVYRCF